MTLCYILKVKQQLFIILVALHCNYALFRNKYIPQKWKFCSTLLERCIYSVLLLSSFFFPLLHLVQTKITMSWQLNIWGEGRFPTTAFQIRRMSIESQGHLRGFTNNLFCDIFYQRQRGSRHSSSTLLAIQQNPGAKIPCILTKLPVWINTAELRASNAKHLKFFNQHPSVVGCWSLTV